LSRTRPCCVPHRVMMALVLTTMEFSVRPVEVREILPWREVYRQEMNCQIIHDSLHGREGWTLPYVIEAGGGAAGYGWKCGVEANPAEGRICALCAPVARKALNPANAEGGVLRGRPVAPGRRGGAAISPIPGLILL
jgi:hypothetical protein